jgi:Family of unknown function (DUF5691)
VTVSFDDLVAAATVGLARRPLEPAALGPPADAYTGLLDRDPAGAVLDAAALLDAARRAGGLSPAPVPLPEPATADDAPELPPAATELLRDALALTDRDLLAEFLTAAAAAGYRASPPELPELLDLAAAHAAWRAPVAGVLGARGRWLAAHQPDWLRVADADIAVPPPDAWQTGRAPERVAWLSAVRRRDPTAARDRLAEGWARESGEDRAVLIAVLEDRLSDADEAFLEAALDDRKGEVRQVARRLLARLPRSAFVTRATARASGVLRLEGRGRGRRLVVTLPDPLDDAARRDGLTARSPYQPVGDRAWQLFQVIAGAPLGLWTDRLSAPADKIVPLEIAGQFAGEVHAAWRAATRRDRDAEWARALLARPASGPLAAPDAQLVALLPVADRVARALAIVRGTVPGTVDDLAASPAPWPAELADAVLALIAGQLRSSAPGAPGKLPGLVGRRVAAVGSAGRARELRELADRFRIRTAAVPTAGRWAAPLERAATVLDRRRAFLEELL